MRKWIFALTFILLMATLIFPEAQTGNLIVTVQTEEGQVLPGATIDICSSMLMGTRTQVAMLNSKAVFRNLPIGIYKIDVTMDGFQPGTLSDIEINLHKTTKAEIIMQLGQPKEIVEVVGGGPLVDTTPCTVAIEYQYENYINHPPLFQYYEKMSNKYEMSFGERKPQENEMIAVEEKARINSPIKEAVKVAGTEPSIDVPDSWPYVIIKGNPNISMPDKCIKDDSILGSSSIGNLIIIALSDSGKTISDANVKINSLSKKRAFKKTTDKNGKAIFKKISAGEYSVVAYASGFPLVKEMDIRIITGKTCTIIEVLGFKEVGTGNEFDFMNFITRQPEYRKFNTVLKL